jgi:hypothetical protein
MKSKLRILISLFPFFTAFTASSQSVDHFNGTQAERDSLKNTSIAIRDAFSKGDVDRILAFHHPDVIKATSYKAIKRAEKALGQV